MGQTLTERDLIKRIRKKVISSNEYLVKGIGDDCSVFGTPGKGTWLISTDMLVDTIHFDRSWHEPYLLGRKSVAVNLSDIAAMGGTPRFILISVSLPPEITDDWILSWFDGVLDILDEYDCVLIGGDTVSGKELTFSITVMGTQLPDGPLYRTGAQPGDSIYVSGVLGSSAAGLEFFKVMKSQEIAVKENAWKELATAHLNPVPQVELGKILCKSSYVTAMLDISDGLATDLGHICNENELRADIDEQMLPHLPVLDSFCSTFSLNKRDLLLKGGEDYQLVFTVKKGCETKLETLVKSQSKEKIHHIGTLQDGNGVFLQTIQGKSEEITFSGFEHTLK